MTIVVPKEYHARKALEQGRILCIDQGDAQKEDIRALRIGILNIMPKAETYEFSLLHPMGRSVLQIEPVWIRLVSHVYASTNQGHLNDMYIPFEDAISKPLDGLIVTGAPVEDMDFEAVSYWEEIVSMFRYAQTHIPSTLGICWGGLAIAKYMGIDKVMFPKKLFGVYKTRNLDRDHCITGDLDDEFWCPQSRHSGCDDSQLETLRERGKVHLLAHSSEVGYTIFESADHRFLAHLGHPEYEPLRLVEEYLRDKKKGRTDVDPPVNFDIGNPVNNWRGHRTEFFSQWIKYIHETICFG